MKKIFITLILFYRLFAFESNAKLQIIEEIASALIHKDTINIYTKDKRDYLLIKDSKLLNPVFSCKEADFILTNKNTKLRRCKNKVIFTTNYLTFKKINYAVGAFFYQKGRPNIIFRKTKLRKFKITLPEEFNKFID